MLKAITLYEPYASLMAHGIKLNETRPMRTSHRGDIAIHAAKTDYGLSDELTAAVVHAFHNRGLKPHAATLGCIVAIVELLDVQPSEKFFRGALFTRDQHYPKLADGQFPLTEEEFNFGNYAAGRFIYRTRRVRKLKTPVPTRGYQSIGWTVPPDIEARVRAELCPHDTDGDGDCPHHPKGCFR